MYKICIGNNKITKTLTEMKIKIENPKIKLIQNINKLINEY